MNESIRAYLAEIGRKGGKQSSRSLNPETARRMVQVREARRAYRMFYAMCFWSSPPEMSVGSNDVAWVARSLMKHGNREAWEFAQRLCP